MNILNARVFTPDGLRAPTWSDDDDGSLGFAWARITPWRPDKGLMNGMSLELIVSLSIALPCERKDILFDFLEGLFVRMHMWSCKLSDRYCFRQQPVADGTRAAVGAGNWDSIKELLDSDVPVPDCSDRAQPAQPLSSGKCLFSSVLRQCAASHDTHKQIWPRLERLSLAAQRVMMTLGPL